MQTQRKEGQGQRQRSIGHGFYRLKRMRSSLCGLRRGEGSRNTKMARKEDDPKESLVGVWVTFHSCATKRALSRFPIRFSYFYALPRPLETVRLLPFCFHLITDVKGLRLFPAHFFQSLPPPTRSPTTFPPLFLYLFQLSARREFVIAFNFLLPDPFAFLLDGSLKELVTMKEILNATEKTLRSGYTACSVLKRRCLCLGSNEFNYLISCIFPELLGSYLGDSHVIRNSLVIKDSLGISTACNLEERKRRERELFSIDLNLVHRV